MVVGNGISSFESLTPARSDYPPVKKTAKCCLPYLPQFSINRSVLRPIARPLSERRKGEDLMASKIDIPYHPLLNKLGRSTDVTTLRGYIGAGQDEGSIRIYASLDDLSESVEVKKDDVIHHEPTPESIQPFGGTTVWIRQDAQTTLKVDRVEKADRVKSFRAGRLNISVAGERLRQVETVCQSVCGVCQSVCGVCQSVCSARFGLGQLGSRLRNRAR